MSGIVVGMKGHWAGSTRSTRNGNLPRDVQSLPRPGPRRFLLGCSHRRQRPRPQRRIGHGGVDGLRQFFGCESFAVG